MRLSDHFSLAEMTRSQTALRRGIENAPPDNAIRNLMRLAAEVLEPIRVLLGVPLQVSSGYRSIALNTAVGGSPNSAHQRGDAADFVPLGMPLGEAFDRIRRSDVNYDQLIEECGADGWIHIAQAPADSRPRRQVMLADGGPGAWRYYPAPPLAVDE